MTRSRFEIVEAYQWYKEQAEGLGEEFLRAVDACLATIQRTPGMYPLLHKQVHRVLLRKFPYCIFYLIESNTVVILACFHARRDPKQWQERV